MSQPTQHTRTCRIRNWWRAAYLAVRLSVLLGGLVGTLLGSPVQLHAALPASVNGEPLPSLAPMLKQVNPAVVNIATYSTFRQAYNPLLNDPFFRHFFNVPDSYRQQPQTQKRQQSAGSGVIVDAKKGVVLTNYHVVKDADEVQVSLIDGRALIAEVVGSDPELDIAVLRVKADDLTDVKMVNSSLLEVGDFVVAIGNPFGLGQTVTTGIVSALGRTGLGIEGYENFIQTDASINPGNSGGALVNLRGELVGINTAIIAPAGGNVGIGFAIPINMAKASMEQILKHGKVQRGHVAISVQDITPDLREAFALKNGQHGVIVTGVGEGSDAHKAGLQAGDIIVTVDGENINSRGQLSSHLAVKAVGAKVKIGVIRKGKHLDITVPISDPHAALTSGQLHPLLEGARFENNPDGDGVIVAALSPKSYAAYSGLRPGDVVLGANDYQVVNLESFQRALKRNKKQVLLLVARGNRALHIVIR